MKQRDGLEFVDCLQASDKHPGLNGKGHHQQNVVSWNAEHSGTRDCEHCGKEQSHKQAGSQLLQSEVQTTP